ncbi:DnaB-like helicase C-terminal domain-containing protein [Streptomyces sp. NPDC126510]|uniref:DnaB-like helicase C-terminal domain-containing protein n=1 Tax=Streptomyces sp. NPDC126510 TaxID=3155317 RepID=UPI00331C5066
MVRSDEWIAVPTIRVLIISGPKARVRPPASRCHRSHNPVGERAAARPGPSVGGPLAAVRRGRAWRGRPGVTRTGVLVVAYGVADPPERHARQSTYDCVTEISRELKILASDTGAVIIALAQLNRGPEQRQDKRPAVSDLRDSGALEQDADAIILLHREDYYEPESERAGETDLIVAKHRNGPTATVTVAHQFHYSRLRDMSGAEEPAL